MEKNELPRGWVWTKIDNVSELVGGGTPSRKNPSYFQGNIVWLTPTEISKNRILVISDSKEKITNVALKKSSAKLIPDGSVLLTSRATIGNIAIAGTKVTTNQGFASFICLESLHNYFLAYWLLYKKNFLINKAKGTTFKEISKSTIREIQIAIPPLLEQKRIVLKIEELFSYLDFIIKNLREQKSKIRIFEKSFLRSVFLGELTSEWRKNNPDVENGLELLKKIMGTDHVEQVKNTNIPEKWIWTSYENLGEWFGGGTPDTRNNEYWNDGTINWFSPKDMKNIKLDSSEEKITKKGIDESSAKLIKKNSLLFVVRSGILRRELPIALMVKDGSVNQDIKSLTPSLLLNSEYLLYASLAMKDDMLHSCSKDGTTVESINTKMLAQYKIPLCSKEEQDVITSLIERTLSDTKNFHEIINEQINLCLSLRSVILKQAFEGKLVPQDPNDEPASELLKRIKLVN